MGETAKLPDGSMFEFWEDETVYDIVLHVNSTHPDADDRNAGTLKAPLKTIQAAKGSAWNACPDPWRRIQRVGTSGVWRYQCITYDKL